MTNEPQINIGNGDMVKGDVREGLQLVAWDSIQDCVPHNCPIGSTCTAKTSKRCSVQTSYLQHLVDTVFGTYRYLDAADVYRVGMHLIPLYSQLCRQKIVELSVGSVTYEDMKGVTRIHPIYKEMRETLKAISLLWKDIGIQGGPGGPNGPQVPGGTNGRAGFGDPNHYTNITQDSDNKRNVVR